ncbi:GSCFA domain-containing protein [Polaribacter sp.]|jgi:hypothetical protein|uniref:GSCFA domain-containing protein n=1 Tax=uncultured Polaribacter sp. TaxID=174711 RepID=UPI00233DFA5E|nr:GSCFA domain-containing protein [Polaribacter sp.]MDB4204712.1 GSCFA domain-containing protein [Polaribacter sp.]MDC1237565.1 GSCFA domain-containing protein [Polaribacter sp.]
MKLQTKIPLKRETQNLIDYKSNLLLLGSCFSENIGDKLSYFKFKATQNPFGILFHPKAIENLISNTSNKKVYSSDDLIHQNEAWHSFDAHSSLSSASENELLNKLNLAISLTNKKIKEASHIVITIGTSWVYRFIETDTIVANCHKIPQKKFLKELLTITEITESLAHSISLIKSLNSEVSITFTVSPIRHLKDGFIENTQSKSHLIAAIHTLVNKQNISYFPSYEIMMDELRDYRFYAEDMIHPNKTAINYIWGKFIDTWFSEETKLTMKEIDEIQKGILHRPFREDSGPHQQFLLKLEQKKSSLKERLPFINF